MVWAAIWGAKGQQLRKEPMILSADTQEISQASLVVQGRLQQRGDGPVRLWQGASDGDRAVSIYWMPDGSVLLYHGMLAYRSEAGLLWPEETFHLGYVVDALAMTGRISLANLDRGGRVSRRLDTGLAPRLVDLLPASDGYLDRLDLAAIATHAAALHTGPGIAAGTRLSTPAGLVAIEDLRPGMLVDTREYGPQPIRWCGTHEVISTGALPAIRLRRPFLGLRQDITVTADTRILISGADVEYQTGHDQVFVRAADCADGVMARPATDRLVWTFHQIMLDDHGCVLAGTCPIETQLLGDVLAARGCTRSRPLPRDLEPCYPQIDRMGALALFSGREFSRRAMV